MTYRPFSSFRGFSHTLRPVFSTTLRKGGYTGGWMMTPSPGWVRAWTARFMAGTTPKVWNIHSGSTFQRWRRAIQRHTACL